MSRKTDLNSSENPEENTPLDSTSVPQNMPSSIKKKKCLRQTVKDAYYEYCSSSTIHGVPYLGQQRPWIEIIFWLCIFIVSIYFCTLTVSNIYVKWHETPVIVSLAEQSTPVWKIPFPAVTICSETKRPFDKTKRSFMELCAELDDEEANFKPNISAKELDEFWTLLQVCDLTPIDSDSEFNIPQDIDYYKILNQMLPDFDSSFGECSWGGKDANCEELFSKTYTEEGICYTFNGLSATDLYRENTVQYQQMTVATATTSILNRTLSWSMERGYDAGSTLQTFPARVLKSGSKAGLELKLVHMKELIDYGCRKVQGFKLVLHSPHNIPLVSKQFLRIPMNKEIRIAIKPNMMTTSDSIRNYRPEKRKCYMDGEMELKYFKVYSEDNCELECLTNYMFEKCGCVKFSMPRTPDMPVCPYDSKCYHIAEDELLMKEFFDISNDIKYINGGGTGCKCMPACTSLEYDIEISQGDFDSQNLADFIAQSIPGAEIRKTPDLSLLSIYFKDNEFLTSKRSELYGLADFIANCGGVFGLFMGVSILSVIEVFYHFSLRLWGNKSRNKV